MESVEVSHTVCRYMGKDSPKYVIHHWEGDFLLCKSEHTLTKPTRSKESKFGPVYMIQNLAFKNFQVVG